MLDLFHPAVRTWFERRFPDGPTAPQAAGWREIAGGGHTLIAAPTGSGKTLAAFLVCIDRLYRQREAGSGPSVVYVSPLKALAVNIAPNATAVSLGLTRRTACRYVAAPIARSGSLAGGGPACAAGSCGAPAGRPAGDPPKPGPLNSGPSMPPSGTMASGRGGRPNGGRRSGTA